MNKITERLLSAPIITSAKYATGYDRTIEHLKAWKLILPETVEETEISLAEPEESQHLGTKLFLYQHLPQLKYFNPKLKIFVYGNSGNQSYLRFKLRHSSTEHLLEIETSGLSHHQIKKKLETMMWPDPASHQ